VPVIPPTTIDTALSSCTPRSQSRSTLRRQRGDLLERARQILVAEERREDLVLLGGVRDPRLLELVVGVLLSH
jgi:hypothetical protein